MGKSGGSNMELKDLIDEINRIKVHKQKGIGASLKKPLLILLLISEIEKGNLKENKIHFGEVEDKLVKLIGQFGGRVGKARPEQPFHHLNSSIIWDIQVPYGVEFNNSKTLNISVLRDPDTYGFFHNDVYKLLQLKKTRSKLMRTILANFWPETVQADITDYLGLSISYLTKRRDFKFTEAVLTNFRNKCAICGFSSLFKQMPFGIDAAHIKWHAYSGPDDVTNGLALCKLHHWAFDRGAITISDLSDKIIVSSKFVGIEEQSISQLERFNNSLVQPYKEYKPNKEFLQWHHENVFIS